MVSSWHKGPGAKFNHSTGRKKMEYPNLEDAVVAVVKVIDEQDLSQDVAIRQLYGISKTNPFCKEIRKDPRVINAMVARAKRLNLLTGKYSRMAGLS